MGRDDPDAASPLVRRSRQPAGSFDGGRSAPPPKALRRMPPRRRVSVPKEEALKSASESLVANRLARQQHRKKTSGPAHDEAACVVRDMSLAASSAGGGGGLDAMAAGCLLPQLAATPHCFRYVPESLEISRLSRRPIRTNARPLEFQRRENRRKSLGSRRWFGLIFKKGWQVPTPGKRRLRRYLETLDLSGTRVSTGGIRALAHFLGCAEDCHLKALRLDKCGVSDGAAAALFRGVERAKCLKNLSVAKNRVGPKATVALAKALHGSRTDLRDLNASGNSLHGLPLAFLCESLAHSVTVRRFDLSWNLLGKVGDDEDPPLPGEAPPAVLALARCLARNRVLHSLSLANCGLDGAAVEALAVGLEENRSLVAVPARGTLAFRFPRGRRRAAALTFRRRSRCGSTRATRRAATRRCSWRCRSRRPTAGARPGTRATAGRTRATGRSSSDSKPERPATRGTRPNRSTSI